MSDFICRKNMMRCRTPGMCSPHGGCQPHGDPVGSFDKHMEYMQENIRLKAEIAGLQTGYEAYERVNAELKAEVEALRKDADRLDRLEIECEAYGTDIHEGNRWVVDGPFATVRDAIDAALGHGEQS
ncbi:hypothetical protein [Pseudomonas grimontii]|uniref:hypothetical protein n=1 Tax=Pseudomonas grimontii TaxID=129847 RepID=UPI0028ED786C|nr:hypothetical protein [Pseudomonas grimontii]